MNIKEYFENIPIPENWSKCDMCGAGVEDIDFTGWGGDSWTVKCNKCGELIDED